MARRRTVMDEIPHRAATWADTSFAIKPHHPRPVRPIAEESAASARLSRSDWSESEIAFVWRAPTQVPAHSSTSRPLGDSDLIVLRVDVYAQSGQRRYQRGGQIFGRRLCVAASGYAVTNL
jgi:hypothetical protein